MDLKQELKRKGTHLLSITFIGIYLLFSLINPKAGLYALSFLLVIAIQIEYLRVELKANIPILSQIWAVLKREKEADKLGGEVFFLLGAILSLALFDFRIAIAAILMTTFGDLAAALVGIKYGKNWLPNLKNKAWEGILAELFVDLVIGFLLLDPIIAIVMALTATFVETVVSKFDDNLMIPLFAGFNGQMLTLLLLLIAAI